MRHKRTGWKRLRDAVDVLFQHGVSVVAGSVSVAGIVRVHAMLRFPCIGDAIVVRVGSRGCVFEFRPATDVLLRINDARDLSVTADAFLGFIDAFVGCRSIANFLNDPRIDRIAFGPGRSCMLKNVLECFFSGLLVDRHRFPGLVKLYVVGTANTAPVVR